MDHSDKRSVIGSLPRNARYTRVAMILHWVIAFCIIYNLVLGFFNWDFGYDFTHQPQNRWLYGLIMISHMSAGITVLALTLVRIAWRLLHEPPAYPATMHGWEKHAAHFAHFFLYAIMLLMPLTGWAILSAHPPAGSEGAKARAEEMAKKMSASGGPGGTPGMAAPGGPPPGSPAGGGPKVFWLIPLPAITPITEIGETAGGVAPLEELHEKFSNYHTIGAWLTVLLLLLHIVGALKHQWMDKQPTLQRMGWGRFPEEKA